jgi:predicted nuclease of restriction endonuclease-like (RecB) superfamily
VKSDPRQSASKPAAASQADYLRLVGEVATVLEAARRGAARAGYGKSLLSDLSADLTRRFGRGFSRQNLQLMRQFYLAYTPERICQTLSGDSALGRIRPSASGKSPKKADIALSEIRIDAQALAAALRLTWSHYTLLLIRARSPEARRFYEAEALRGGWSVRQLERQIESQFYERVALSRDKGAMLRKGPGRKTPEAASVTEAIRDPYVLEFLDLKDEYSESDLESALIRHLETFLLELGGDFAFIARQRRLRVGAEWHRVDLVFYHRALRRLFLIDLKLGKFTHADAGQMHLYLNYAREHWTRDDENPPVGLILCSHKDAAVAHYALEGLDGRILAAEYRTMLPDEKLIEREIEQTRRRIEKLPPRRAKLDNAANQTAKTPRKTTR